MISEFTLIQSIKDAITTMHGHVLCGIGDDCAVLEKDAKTVSLITTDVLVEGIHFDLNYFSFIDLGKKALSVNLSDIAAMAGSPVAAFVTLGIPKPVTESNIIDLYTGFSHVAGEFGVAIAGGDLSVSLGPFFVSLTVLGEAAKNAYKLRSAAIVGDGIYVSGNLGSAAVGLALCEKRRKVENSFVQAFKNPRPRLYLAKILADFPQVHAAIDLSDGLVQDLSHVMRASGVAAKLDLSAIPTEPDFVAMCQKLKLDPVATLLSGGEDYQLCFTMDDAVFADLKKRLEERKIKVTRIGDVVGSRRDVASSGDAMAFVTVFDANGQEVHLKKNGFDHFA